VGSVDWGVTTPITFC